MNSHMPGGSLPQETPGHKKSFGQTFLEIGASALQNFAPVKHHKMHFCGFAFYSGDISRQVELHHYAASVNDEVFQCAVYDSPNDDARLIGIEYVITEEIFATLDPEEQKYWHNHAYDVKSGSFIAPGLPNALEKKVMTDMMHTYGKTWILWQTDRGDKLPLGPPQLMMTAHQDGQWDPQIFEAREERRGSNYNYDVEACKESRKDMKMPPIHPAADHWTYQKPLQFKMVPTEP